jgi:hypothetical protein
MDFSGIWHYIPYLLKGSSSYSFAFDGRFDHVLDSRDNSHGGRAFAL